MAKETHSQVVTCGTSTCKQTIELTGLRGASSTGKRQVSAGIKHSTVGGKIRHAITLDTIEDA